jgi:hypothetical protein
MSLTTFRCFLRFLVQPHCWGSAVLPLIGWPLPGNYLCAGSVAVSTSSLRGYEIWWHRERVCAPARVKVAVPVPQS